MHSSLYPLDQQQIHRIFQFLSGRLTTFLAFELFLLLCRKQKLPPIFLEHVCSFGSFEIPRYHRYLLVFKQLPQEIINQHENTSIHVFLRKHIRLPYQKIQSKHQYVSNNLSITINIIIQFIFNLFV